MTILIIGVANERSLAWAITQQLRQTGQSVVLSWQGPTTEKRVKQLTRDWDQAVIGQACDLADEHDIFALADWCRTTLPDGLSGMVHCAAAGRMRDDDGLSIPLSQVPASEVARCLQISAHSFNQLLAALAPHLHHGAAALTLSYHGAERVAPGYDLMAMAKAALESCVRYQAVAHGPDLRVNAIRAGSIRTLASSGVPGFTDRYRRAAANAPLGRAITGHDVAYLAEFLLSERAAAITGQVITVDGGWSCLSP